MTLASGAWLSPTIRSFSTVVHRRRRSGPERTETLLTFAHLLANQSANYRRQGCRPEGGPHRRVTLPAVGKHLLPFLLSQADRLGESSTIGSICLNPATSGRVR